MSANSAVCKFKMVNGLIGSILEENHLTLQTLFQKVPQINPESSVKIQKLLESRERIRQNIEDDEILDGFVDDLNLANYFLACRKFDDSLRYYESALVKNPQSYSALCNKGLCLYKMSKLEDAVSCYDEALKIYKNIPNAFFMKGKIMFAQKKFSEAVTAFNNVLELEPENLDAQYNLGKAHLRSGNSIIAITTLEKIIEKNNHLDSLLLLSNICINEKDYQKSIIYLGTLLEQSPNHIEAHMLLGKTLLETNDPKQAIEHFEKILSRSPNHIEAHLLLGKTHMNIENFNSASIHFEKILEFSPNHIDASNSKIMLLEKMGKIEDAIECCDKLGTTLSEPNEHILKKGILLFKNDQLDDALGVFNEVLGKSTTNNSALLYKAKIFTKNQEFQEALLCLETILKSDPHNVEALEESAGLSLKVGNYEDSLSYVNKLLLNTASLKFLRKKSSLLSVLGRHEESGQIGIEILKKDKNDFDILYELGKTHMILHNFEKATDFFDLALSIRPHDSRILYKKSIAFLAQQKFDSSILCLEQISPSESLYDFAQYQKSKIQMIQGNVKQSMEILSRVIKSNDIFKQMASNETVFESISNTFEFQELTN